MRLSKIWEGVFFIIENNSHSIYISVIDSFILTLSGMLNRYFYTKSRDTK